MGAQRLPFPKFWLSMGRAMKKHLSTSFVAAAVAMSMTHSHAAEAQISHVVLFDLVDDSEAAKIALIEAANTYLTDHPGMVSYAVGVRQEEASSPVNMADFDVSLHLVFDSQDSHAAYDVAPRHREFIGKMRENWESVRVIDTVLAP